MGDGQLDRYKQWLADLGLDHVEISDGAVDIPRKKLSLIAELARDFTVLSEVGSRTRRSSSLRRVDAVAARGARRRRLEGDHRGPRGRQLRDLHVDGSMRTDVVEEIGSAVDLDDVIFEAPTKARRPGS